MLELGVGNGEMTRILLRAAVHVTAVDYSRSVVEYTRSFGPAESGLLTVHEDDFLTDLAWERFGDEFDVVIASLVFHDVPVERRLEFLRAVAGALRVGGLLLLADPVRLDAYHELRLAQWAVWRVALREPERVAGTPRDEPMGRIVAAARQTLDEERTDDPRMVDPIAFEELTRLSGEVGLRHERRIWQRMCFSCEVFSRSQ